VVRNSPLWIPWTSTSHACWTIASMEGHKTFWCLKSLEYFWQAQGQTSSCRTRSYAALTTTTIQKQNLSSSFGTSFIFTKTCRYIVHCSRLDLFGTHFLLHTYSVSEAHRKRTMSKNSARSDLNLSYNLNHIMFTCAASLGELAYSGWNGSSICSGKKAGTAFLGFMD